MHKAFEYLLLLVIGLGVGASIGMMIQTLETTKLVTEEKVTLIDIECTRLLSDRLALCIILKNTFTERILNGNVTVFQGGNVWTSEVDWRSDWRDGYGFAEVTCDSLIANQSLRLKYAEKYSSETYFDRVVEWDEVRVSNGTFVFEKTEELSFTSYTWDSASTPTWIQIAIKNTGSADVTISEVRVNDVAAADDGITTPYSLAAGDSVTLNVTRTGGYTSGVKYEFTVVTAKGNTFGPYIRTTP